MTRPRALARVSDAVGARLNQVPIRLRLALTFAGVMVVLFGVLFLVLYVRYEAGLDSGISASLQSRAADLALLASESDARLAAHPLLPQSADGFAQILSPNGAVLASTPGLAKRPLLRPAQLSRTIAATVSFQQGDRAELHAYRVGGPGVAVAGAPGASVPASKQNVLVVGVSLASRNAELDELETVMFVGGPIALLIACAAGYAVAARALAPVENMRRRAARMVRFESNERLPVSAAHDEIRALGTTLNEMLARVEEVVERGRAFVGGASHELRSPLTILQLELDDAVAGERSPEDLEAAIESAREEVRRLTALTEDLLVLAQTDQARLPLNRERFEAHGAMRVIADRYAQLDGLVGRTVTVAPGPPAWIEADIARFDQALSNLVLNALRFSDGPVVMRVAGGPDEVELHVLDRGPGFPPEFLPQAFERFSRADPARSRRGTGLGLSIVQGVVEAHGGRVAARNRPDGGADVWITLPAAAADEARQQEVSSGRTPATRSGPTA
jgi:two-component system, OmpR family, sensor kinase